MFNLFKKKEKIGYVNPYQSNYPPQDVNDEDENEDDLLCEMLIHYTPHATYVYVDYCDSNEDTNCVDLFNDDGDYFRINGTYVIVPINDDIEKEKIIKGMLAPLSVKTIIIDVTTKEIKEI